MKLSYLRTEHFDGLPDRGFAFADRAGAARTVVVRGSSGSGKTSLVSAIVAAKELIAPYSRRPNLRERSKGSSRPPVLETAWELDAVERESTGTEGAVETTVSVQESERPSLQPAALSQLMRAYSHDPAQGKVDFFPEHRALGSPPSRPDRERTETEERFLRLTDDPSKYRSLWTYFRKLAVRGAVEQESKLRREGALFADEAGSGLAPLANALSKLTDTVTLIGQENESLLFQDRAGRRFGPSGLSASAADALLFAGSLLMVGHQRSVILIDRVDLYRQAIDAVKFLRGMRELVGDSQIIATTSSKELAESGVADCVIDLDEAR
jgi:hypothetical protein